jgi:ATP-dependent RNA helicase DDX55/SPB4
VSKLTDEERKEEDRLNGMIEDMRKKVAIQEAKEAAEAAADFEGFSD